MSRLCGPGAARSAWVDAAAVAGVTVRVVVRSLVAWETRPCRAQARAAYQALADLHLALANRAGPVVPPMTAHS